MKREMKRKGFTLIELLIVIVVIGILSAMMMMSSTEAVTAAKASNIVSNLRNMKTAVLSYYLDNMDKFSGMQNNESQIKQIDTDKILPYLRKTDASNTAENKSTLNGYWISCVDGVMYVACQLDHASVSSNQDEWIKIRDKLAGRAKSTGLQFTNSVTMTTIGTLTSTVAANDKDNKFVVMWVR